MAENEKQASEASKANKENLSYQKRRMKQNSELLSQGNEALKQDYQRLNVAKELNQLAEKAVQHKFDTSNALRDISNIEQDIKDILNDKSWYNLAIKSNISTKDDTNSSPNTAGCSGKVLSNSSPKYMLGEFTTNYFHSHQG